jgi:lysozyme family protein
VTFPTEERIIDAIIRREGDDYSDRAADNGGPTRYGITLETLREERGPLATFQDVQRLTEEAARAIYRERYIRRPGFDQVTDAGGIRALLIDFGVNSGPKRAVRALQVAVGSIPDGRIGPDTLARLQQAIDTDGAAAVYAAILGDRLRYYLDIVFNDPSVKRFIASNQKTQLRNLRGWVNRFIEFL